MFSCVLDFPLSCQNINTILGKISRVVHVWIQIQNARISSFPCQVLQKNVQVTLCYFCRIRVKLRVTDMLPNKLVID